MKLFKYALSAKTQLRTCRCKVDMSLSSAFLFIQSHKSLYSVIQIAYTVADENLPLSEFLSDSNYQQVSEACHDVHRFTQTKRVKLS